MGFDTHMIAGGRACSTSTRLTHPNITNQTGLHFAEALGAEGLRASVERLLRLRASGLPTVNLPVRAANAPITTARPT